MSPSRHKTIEDFLRQIVGTGKAKFHLQAETDADGNLSVCIEPADIDAPGREFRALGHSLRPV